MYFQEGYFTKWPIKSFVKCMLMLENDHDLSIDDLVVGK